MQHLPEWFKNDARAVKLTKPIDNIAPDYYQWGINTRIVCLDDLAAAEAIVRCPRSDTGWVFKTSEQFDEFWNGYWHGIEQVVESLERLRSVG